MQEYAKPIVLENEELSEGVYAASGSDCYTASGYIHQTPQQGRGDYRIQLNAKHAATDSHHSGCQIATLTFNQPVVYKSSNGSICGTGTGNTIEIEYGYHNNGSDNIGLGDVIVEADAGLALTNVIVYCNHDCGQH